MLHAFILKTGRRLVKRMLYFFAIFMAIACRAG